MLRIIKDIGLCDQVNIFVFEGSDERMFEVFGNREAKNSICYVDGHYYCKDENYKEVAKMIIEPDSVEGLREMTFEEM